MKYLDREDRLNTMVHPIHTLKISDFDVAAEPYDPRPLTPKEVEEKQRKNAPGSPYLPNKSPIPSRKDIVSRKNDMTIANLRPQDFIPFTPATRDNDGFAMPYLRTPELRQMELEHFMRFIQNTSGDDFVKRNSPMMIAKGKKKKKKGLTIHEEAARRDAFRDMGKEPYDPDTGRLGGGFDIMDDLLDGV